MIFVCTLVLATLVFTALAAYAAHCLLVVVEDTSAGNDVVQWPDEPYRDWIWKPVYLAWLIAFWAFPVAIIVRLTRPPILHDSVSLQILLFSLPGLWLFFPISLLSSLSARSRWVVFRPAVLVSLASFAPTTLGFYAISVVLVGIVGVALYAGLAMKNSIYLLPLVGGVLAAVFLIYARLLGRMAWLLTTVRKDVDETDDEEQPLPLRRSGKKKRPPPPVHDPWKAPTGAPDEGETPVVSTPLDGEIEGYGLADENKPREVPVKKKKRPFEEPEGSYDLAAEAPPPAKKKDDFKLELPRHRRQDIALPKPSTLEMRLAVRTAPPPPPRMPLVSGVFNFPWYQEGLGPWFKLSVGFFAFLAILNSLLALWPSGLE
jgi:hypothetical protein